ncbi:zinc-dependent alcohol dehydrogenase [Rhodococcus opacus]|uniref:zinc-dependent alcohol dehydrogenase n=1 Tax=Rhodococcus opacus TaxID=37919 RepID=UPI001F57CF3D|nr:zinc-binding alcohol dehydrogenase [Rhodococcus opacus]UNN05225.1 zinc-binding alcohol dehydrogenase [Rhodococcus opacus]
MMQISLSAAVLSALVRPCGHQKGGSQLPRRLAVVDASTIRFEHYDEQPLKDGQVRFRALHSAVSTGTELMLLEGRAPRFTTGWDGNRRLTRSRTDHDRPYPVGIGYQFVGEVVDAASELRDQFTLGDVFWIDAHHADSITIDVRTAPPMRRFNLANSWHAAFFPMVRIALGAVHDARPLIGDHATVFGGGMIGLLSAVLLRRSGTASVTLVEPQAARRHIAQGLGLHTIDPAVGPPADILQDSGIRADVVIEASGNYEALDEALRAARMHGTVVVVSSYGNQDAGIRLGHEFHRNRLTVLSSMTINGCAHRDHPRWDLERLNAEAARLIENKKLGLDQMGVENFAFEDAPEAFKYLADREAAPPSVRFDYGAGR